MKNGNTDLPCDNQAHDALSMARYAQGLARFIRDCSTPMTIAIQGEWGSGKTSLMNMVDDALNALSQSNDQSKKKTTDAPGLTIQTIRFETWPYGAVGEDDALGLYFIASLTNQILNKSTHKVNAAFAESAAKISIWAKTLAKAVAAAAVNRATLNTVDGSTLMAGLGVAHGRDVLGPQGNIEQLSQIKTQFKRLVQQAANTENGPERFVIFIDDLDRIRPGNAVALLEVLKNFADVEHCVFVVACDYDVVRQGVASRLGIKDERKVEAFFHKIFQLPFSMPTSQYKIQKILIDFFLRKAAHPNTAAAVGRAEGMATKLASLVESAVGTNPRSVKRFLNVLDLLACIPKADESPDGGTGAYGGNVWEQQQSSLICLVGLVALQTRWPRVAGCLSILARHSDGDARFEEMVRAIGNQLSDDELRNQINDAYEDDGLRDAEIEALERFGAEFEKIRQNEHESLRHFRYWARELALAVGQPVERQQVTQDDFVRRILALHGWRGEAARGFFEDLRARDLDTIQVVRTGYFYTQAVIGKSKPMLISLTADLVFTLHVNDQWRTKWHGWNAAAADRVVQAAKTLQRRLQARGIVLKEAPGKPKAVLDVSAGSLSDSLRPALWEELLKFHVDVDRQLAGIGRAAMGAGGSSLTSYQEKAEVGGLSEPPEAFGPVASRDVE